MADPNQAQLAALLALLASQQTKGPVAGANPLSVPPPSASGSIDLSNLAKPTTSGSGLFDSSAPRYGEAYSDRKYPPEDNYYRQRDRDDRYPPPRSAGYDEARRYPRDGARDWERDRDRDRDRDNRWDRDRDYDHRDQRRQGRYRERSASPGPRRHHSPDSRDEEDRMTIETMHVGMVIGRGGDTLRRIERETGARVQFAPESQSRPGVRVANILGSPSQVNAARSAIKALVESSLASKGVGSRRDGHGVERSTRGKDMSMPAGTNKFTFTVPDKCVGLIIGRGGESINEIQRRSGARVNIVPEAQSVNGRRPVNLFGTDEANQRAKELIEVIVKQDELGIKKSQSNSGDSGQRSNTYEQSTGQGRSSATFDGSATSYADTQPHPSQQQANPSQFGTYQSRLQPQEFTNMSDPFQYLQTSSGAGPVGSDNSAAQAWAAYYAQQQQQQQQPPPSSNYPHYSDDGT